MVQCIQLTGPPKPPEPGAGSLLPCGSMAPRLGLDTLGLILTLRTRHSLRVPLAPVNLCGSNKNKSGHLKKKGRSFL